MNLAKHITIGLFLSIVLTCQAEEIEHFFEGSDARIPISIQIETLKGGDKIKIEKIEEIAAFITQLQKNYEFSRLEDGETIVGKGFITTFYFAQGKPISSIIYNSRNSNEVFSVTFLREKQGETDRKVKAIRLVRSSIPSSLVSRLKKFGFISTNE